FGDCREYDTAAVIERFGFVPSLIPDYKALVGDTSDNIPGVAGIGDKTAKALISKFGSLEEIVAHIDEVTPTRAKNSLSVSIETASHSKMIATIVRDLDLEVDMDDARVAHFDREAVAELFRVLEFRTLLRKLPEPAEQNAAATTVVPPSTPARDVSRTTVIEEHQLDALIARIRETKTVAVDVETTSTEPLRADLVGIALAVSPEESYYIPVGHLNRTPAPELKSNDQHALDLDGSQQTDDAPIERDPSQLGLDLVRDRLNPVLADDAIKKYTHHGKYDYHVLIRHGFTPGPLAFDTMIAAYLLGDSSIRLKDLSFNRLGIEMTEITELIGTGKNQATMDTVQIDLAAPYACGDVESTFGLVAPLAAALEERQQTDLLATIELPLVSVLIDMERSGIAIDTDELAEFSVELGTRLKEIVHAVNELARRPINLGSNKQLATLLFEELGLPSGRKTKTGFSVDSEVLENIIDQHPIVPLILEFRTLSKLKSTYVDALPLQVNPQTGRIHTSYNQTVAATGRLSSQNPNLQNIPIRTEIGRRVREAFVADRRPEFKTFDDAVLLAADYSQMELRILAHMSEEPFLVEAFKSGLDIHRATAALVNDISVEDVTSDQRRIAKTVNFGILYGMQAFGLSRDTGMSRAAAQEFITAYWARLPKVKEFFDKTIEEGREHGYVSTLLMRRRYLPDLGSSNGARRAGAQRMAMNMPIQGTQADMIKIAMIDLEHALVEKKLPARQVLQVHDELVLEVERSALDETARLVSEKMIGALALKVPVIAEARSGVNWEEMTALELGG
ncbi:MAG: DNA polymerase I, partial [Thermomicrobiales bacterium]